MVGATEIPMTADLTNPIFTDEAKATAHIEASRWPDGVNCPFCGSVNVHRMGGLTQAGMFLCNDCRDKFTVRTKTVFERSHIPLHKWLLALHLMSASKKGVSAHQLHRMLGITYKSAWFMAHRIREAMKDESPSPLGGEGKTVEADETYIGNSKGAKRSTRFVSGKGWVKRGGGQEKYKVVSLVERGGAIRSVKVDYLTANAVRDILVRNASRKSKLMTDESNVYVAVGKEFASHDAVNHSIYEWARGSASTNTIEGAFSIFKRGMRGIYQHCSEAHLQRYLAEFDFRYNNRVKLGIGDAERAAKALKGAEGKRLTYRQPRPAPDAETESPPFHL
jgi:transposase-like protein